MKTQSLLFSFVAVAFTLPALGWDYEGHRMVNQAALAALPREFPAFVRAPANAERIAFLSGEADRWRNVPDGPIKHYNSLDHYCDLEQIPEAGLSLASVPSHRYEFAMQFAAGRAADADKFPKIDPAKNSDRTREWPGFAPWAIAEYYGKLRSAFSYLRIFQEMGTPEEIANAEANIVYLMGVMGHYVGDCAQPLHTTQHHNGWIGENPQRYTTWKGFHSWIDGGFSSKAQIRLSDVVAKVSQAKAIPVTPRADGRDPMFVAVMTYLVAQHAAVEPLYRLEKNGKLGVGDQTVSAEGRSFIVGQLTKGGHMLGAIWLTAWVNALPDTYLRNELTKRKASTTSTPKAKR